MISLLLAAGDPTGSLRQEEGAAVSPVVLHDLAPGVILTVADIAVEARAASSNDNRVTDYVGFETRRFLPKGTTLRLEDLRRPVLVLRNSLVEIQFEDGPLLMSAEGRALSSGAVGEVVKVMNTNSRVTVSAVVTGAGRVAAK